MSTQYTFVSNLSDNLITCKVLFSDDEKSITISGITKVPISCTNRPTQGYQILFNEQKTVTGYLQSENSSKNQKCYRINDGWAGRSFYKLANNQARYIQHGSGRPIVQDLLGKLVQDKLEPKC